MSDEQDKPVEEQSEPEVESEGPRCGERLAEARREQHISVQEVAKELHLDEPKVRALERNDFEMLGAPVFAKGHLRKYAQLVGVDEDDVFADYYKMTRQETMPPVIVGRHRVRQDLSPGPWIAVIVVIIVAVASYWWFAVVADQAASPATAPEETPIEQQGVVIETVVQDSEPEIATQPAPAPVASESQPRTAAAVPVADGEVSLSLTFTGDCWTEISDARGQRLFFEMGRSGSSVELTGVAPFAVLFGNVDNVDVRVNGNDYPVSSNNPGSRMARLTITNP
jgi:cytoskeleton protein RodZ